MTLTGLIFMVAFLCGLGLALVRSPLFGLLTYVAVFYLHPPSRWWGESLPDLRWSMLAAAVTLVATLRYRGDPSRPSWITTTPAKLLITYTVWLWIQSFWALDPEKHFECSVLFTKYVLVYYMIYRLLDTPEKIRWFYLVHLGGCLYLGLVAWGTDVSGRLDGVGGPGIDDSNTLGMHIATGVIVAAMLLNEKKAWWAFCAVAAAFSLNTLVLAGSRGAFLALLLGCLMLYWLRPRAYSKKFATYAMIAALAFGAIASKQFWDRMHTLEAAVGESNEKMDLSAESRIAMAKAQLRMAKHYPFGNGHRGSEVLSGQYLDHIYMAAEGGRSSHNTFLTALVEQGIPGVILFLAYCWWGLRSTLRLRELSKPEQFDAATFQGALAACCLMIVFIAGMFADFLKVEVQIWMVAIVATVLQMHAVPSQVTRRQTALTRGPARLRTDSAGRQSNLT